MNSLLSVLCLYLRLILVVQTTEYSPKSSDFSLTSYSWREGLFAHCWEKIEFWRSLMRSLFKYEVLGKWKATFLEGDFDLSGDLPSVWVVRPATFWVAGAGGFPRFGKLASGVPHALDRPLPVVLCMSPLTCSSLCVRRPDPSQPCCGCHHLCSPSIYLNLSLWFSHSGHLHQCHFS